MRTVTTIIVALVLSLSALAQVSIVDPACVAAYNSTSVDPAVVDQKVACGLAAYTAFLGSNFQLNTDRWQAVTNKVNSNTQAIADTNNKIGTQQAELDTASNNAAGALSFVQQLIAGLPCVALDPIKVELNVMGQRVLTGTVDKPCKVWASGVGTLPVIRACQTQGTMTQNQDQTLTTSFAFPLPASYPAHGCLVIQMWTEGGTASERAILY